MAYTSCVNLVLGSSQTGLTLTAQAVDTAGSNVGAPQSTIVEISGGNYLATLSIPDAHRGGVKFLSGATLKAFVAINPEESEYPDAKTSTRSTYAGADTAGTTTLLSRLASALTITGGKVDVNDKTGYALSSAGVQAIWDALTSALSTANSIGKHLVDTLTGFAGSAYTSVRAAKLDLLGTGSVTFVGPVSPTGATVTIIQGDDYDEDEGRALEWVDSGATWPDLTDATIAFAAKLPDADTALEVVGSVVVPAGANKRVRVELTHAHTGGLTPHTAPPYAFAVIATLEDGHVVTLRSGLLVVRASPKG